uniref:Uncharacterized protein n=1 Tax=Glyptapanteles indiensis TaxID=92994 RepID=B7S963_GLYIN|nr:conserved hypothetical protein [Glyptapanteles indiensis]
MSRIVSIMCILMGVTVLNTMAEACVPVNSYCGNMSPCCPVEKMVNGELKAIEAICDTTMINGHTISKPICKPIDGVPNLREIVELNTRIKEEYPYLLHHTSCGSNMPEGYLFI